MRDRRIGAHEESSTEQPTESDLYSHSKQATHERGRLIITPTNNINLRSSPLYPPLNPPCIHQTHFDGTHHVQSDALYIPSSCEGPVMSAQLRTLNARPCFVVCIGDWFGRLNFCVDCDWEGREVLWCRCPSVFFVTR